MSAKEIKFYNGEVFTENDNFEFILPESGKWFDWCPCEGILDFKTDKGCMCHFCIKDMGDYFNIAIVPNCGNVDYIKYDDDYKKLLIYKFIKADAYKYVNEFNSDRCIYKVGEACLNAESIFIIGGKQLLECVVEDYQEAIKILSFHLPLFLTEFNI